MVRNLAKSHHAPADWKFHAQMVCSSWAAIHKRCVSIWRASRRGCRWAGHASRIRVQTEVDGQERSRIHALAKQAPPGHLVTQADETMMTRDEEGSAQWTLNALAQAAKEAGSQIRCIFLREGVRWRHTHSWGESSDPDFVPKGRRSSAPTPSRPRDRRPSAPMNWGQ